MTKEEKKKKLFEMVSRARQNVKEDHTCQYNGGDGERFCRSTSLTTCKGCTSYSVGIWDFFAKCYDLMVAKGKEITDLRYKLEMEKIDG